MNARSAQHACRTLSGAYWMRNALQPETHYPAFPPNTAGASLVRPAGQSIRLRRAHLPFTVSNQTVMDSLGSYGTILLYLTRFISRAKLSVKTAQLPGLPLTSDAIGAAYPPAGWTATPGGS